MTYNIKSQKTNLGTNTDGSKNIFLKFCINSHVPSHGFKKINVKILSKFPKKFLDFFFQKILSFYVANSRQKNARFLVPTNHFFTVTIANYMPLAFRKCTSHVWCNSSPISHSPRNCGHITLIIDESFAPVLFLAIYSLILFIEKCCKRENKIIYRQ